MKSRRPHTPGPAVQAAVDSEEEPPPGPGGACAGPAGYSDLPLFALSARVTVLPSAPFALPSTQPFPSPVRQFRRRHYRGLLDREWNDWRWQLRHRLRTLEQLERFVALTPDERSALEWGPGRLPLAITPYYLSLIAPDDPAQPLRRTVVPSGREFVNAAGEADDPLAEEHQAPVPGLVHRYPDRALLLLHDFCAAYCRYCTRSRMVGLGRLGPGERRLERALEYLRQTPAIRDVLLSGGDPLTLSEGRLEWLLTRLRQIPHIEIVRIGTKVPAVLPQRITSKLTRVLRRFHPLWMSVHFTHPDECTAEAAAACARLADAGIPLGSQTVLLKGINDDLATLRSLMHGLMRMRVRPYYLYQCDPVRGTSHFRTSVSKGLELLQGLRGFTSGYAVPHFVVDSPGGGGKVALTPEALVGRDGNDLLLRNFEGRVLRYPDPPETPAEVTR